MTDPQPAATLSGADFNDLCVLAVAARPDAGALATSRVPGLPDDAYESDGQITRRELRALALAALRPGPARLLWDVGAGSGSIGIEWMRADPLARAIAVEARPDRAARVSRNAAALGRARACGGQRRRSGGAGRPARAGRRLHRRRADRRRRARGLLGRAAARAAAWSRTRSRSSRSRCCTGGSGPRAAELVKVAVSYLEPLGSFTTWRPALPVTQWQVTKR